MFVLKVQTSMDSSLVIPVGGGITGKRWMPDTSFTGDWTSMRGRFAPSVHTVTVISTGTSESMH